MLSVVMLNVTMPSVEMLNIVMLSVVMLNITLLNVAMLSIVMLSVVMLSVILLNVTMLSIVMLGFSLTLQPVLPLRCPECRQPSKICGDDLFSSGTLCDHPPPLHLDRIRSQLPQQNLNQQVNNFQIQTRCSYLPRVWVVLFWKLENPTRDVSTFPGI